MDLQNGKITVNQLLSHPEAKALLMGELPTLMNPSLLQMAGGMCLDQVLSFAKGKIPAEKLKRILDQLKRV